MAASKAAGAPRPGRHVQPPAVQRQVSLRRHAGEARRVRERGEVVSRRVVLPDHAAVAGVEAIDEHAVARPHAGREVQAVAVDQHARPCRPVRDHLLVADQLLDPRARRGTSTASWPVAACRQYRCPSSDAAYTRPSRTTGANRTGPSV